MQDFTTPTQDDTIPVSDFDEESKDAMILYTYVDRDYAQNLFKYFVGLRFNTTRNYIKQNPLQIPITLYETPKIAKIMAADTNEQLIAFSINSENKIVYDDFNLALRLELKQSNIKTDTYKSKSSLWREKKRYEGIDYIEITVRDKDVIKEIQLQ